MPKNPEIIISQNLIEELNYWQMAGIGIGQRDSFIIQSKIQNLGLEEGVKRVQFWGKIRTMQGFYYVIEGIRLKNFKEEGKFGWERRG